MNPYKKLLKNSAIFAIANLGSKLISIILVPFYTYVLSTEEYGQIDIFTTTIYLLIPIITLNICDATLRFSLKSKYNKKNIFSSSFVLILSSNFLMLTFYPILSRISYINGYLNLFYIIILLQTINSILAQFARGIGEIKKFAINGVINTFITMILNILLLTRFNMGIKGYFLSIVIANIVCNIYLIVSTRIFKYFDFKHIEIPLLKEMLLYSLPLIPNSLMWWINNMSDRYILTIFLGASANGLYAVANKIPTILSLLNSIFSQAWQLSAVEESEDKDKSKFYSKVFESFSVVMLIGTSAIIVIIKDVIMVTLSKNYNDVWRYTPFLLLGIVFSSFSTFLGTNYVAMKKTSGALRTTLIGAVVNIVLNIILIPKIGINGAAIATMISFFIIWILRIYDTKKFVNIMINKIILSASIFVILIQTIILLMNLRFNILIQIILFFINLIINRHIIRQIILR